MAISPPDYVTQDRGLIIENRHAIHAAITNASGRLLYAVGDPTRLTLIRSAAKPAQSVAVLEALASPSPDSTLPPDFTLSDEDVALMSASHSSEEAHLDHARALLRRGGNSPSDLKCGGHPAISPAVNERWIREGIVPEGIHNNCSGKHAGMLAASRALASDGYHLPIHPIQVQVKEVVEDLVGGLGEVKWAVDGCNLPAPAMPLTSLATMYASFASADPSSPQARERHMARVFGAMHEHPFLVSGTGRFCAAIASIPGVVGKVGADACYGVGIRGEGIGIAVKVEDGNMDILWATVAEIMERLGVGTAEERRAMDKFHRIERRNTAGIKIGEVAFPFVLRDMREA
ncbi:hypothetical protein CcaverHIS002_0110540 [Cutaneotrichosporon cavernicola]|uniref:L-asparaginase II n=1 Tax=Cutaneotrichosporon cavernicola TaxID=279322 RepID=A0AA48KZ72_9TREE|nr:uncharacterized protein CcaverHIS019_0110440 [Cutaneotrichosporon cavernicola]BEI80525.1 hypothetical protein CcaverHIS002_0110540 [Cutaneotrichosporon cavernicola]BEI88326.1 hypothetical protein CcaverHIS019_0110440 [Cutaneotrichosporon cavernicola]BEI96099.1 hypothetical protein CcaverHIS631_0110480 [Cutaneotrichosporon cavernicola]BEJ03871.1 hypothetical protein CcaverHIS641_0110460 [Cutaneotrichosporon cavernicola]